MVSGFLSPEWGHLCNGETWINHFFFLSHTLTTTGREACIMFKPGKNHNGYFDAKELIDKVNCTINIFEDKTNQLAQGLFVFNNTPSHQKHAANAISARKMVKSVLFFAVSRFYLIDVHAPPTSPRSQVVFEGPVTRTGNNL